MVRAVFVHVGETMKRKNLSHKDIISSSNQIGPEDGADPRIYFRKSSDRRNNRKALQLCGQVARVLGQVLAWEFGDELLGELSIESVVPAPNSSHLLVTVSAPGDASVGEILERLQRHMGRLRAEVAKSIHRKRVPELSFRVCKRGEVRP